MESKEFSDKTVLSNIVWSQNQDIQQITIFEFDKIIIFNLFWSILMFYLILTIDECIFSVWSLSIFFYVNCFDDIFYRSIAILHTMGERITSTIEWFLLVECCEELILQKFIDTIYKRKYISKLNVGRVIHYAILKTTYHITMY